MVIVVVTINPVTLKCMVVKLKGSTVENLITYLKNYLL